MPILVYRMTAVIGGQLYWKVTVNEPEYAPSAVVVVSGNEPPTVTIFVPAEPIVPLNVWAPELIALVVTVSELLPLDIVKVAGTEIDSACPPSPVAVSVADVGAGLEIAATPIPVTATALAPAVRLTVP